MDGQAGPQLAAPPIFFHHQSIPGLPIGRKRDFPWQSTPQIPQNRPIPAELRNSAGSWNPRMWDWDSRNFTAKPSALPVVAAEDVAQRNKKAEESSKGGNFAGIMDVDGENLTLKLGGGSGGLNEESTVALAGAGRPVKRVRAGSPGSGGGSYPMCQVDDCRTDLTGAKDYHRRHKVCELHSKASHALVGKQMQRFCQQCSRFHPLSEFDEGKRSCRRRLAGHNRRRRKTQPEEAPSRLLLPGTLQNAATGNLDIINLLSVLARLQGSNQGKPISLPPLPDKDRLIQLLSKINTPNTANTHAKTPVAGGFDLNVSQAPHQDLAEQLQKASGETAPTKNLVEALSAALKSSSPDALASVSQGSSESSHSDKTKDQSVETITDVNSQNKMTPIFSSAAAGRNNNICHSPSEVAQPPVSEMRPSLPFQLFGSIENGSPPKTGSAMKYLSSESSNPIEERSPSSSPPVTQKLFPLHSTAENPKNVRESNYREENGTVELSTSLGWSRPMELFQKSERRVEHNGVRSLPYQAGYASSSGSDHSPSSSNSDAQDRTGRIIFKLFGKDPSNFPTSVRADIMNWLANSPSEMESYIRPGCVVLSVYVSMSSVAWEELEEDLLQRVNSLVQSSESDFWRNGRFLVRTNRRLVSHKDGKIHLSKSWRALSAPELMSVKPIAVVGGQEVSLVLKGRNLAVPGTKIYCTHMGKYTSKDVLCSTHPGTIYDDSSVEKFEFPGGFSKDFGRCFIEVENGFKGNSFPLIIASASICQELRVLESDFEEGVHNADGISEEHGHGRPQSREDVLHFLNELGWLFQKTDNSLGILFQDFPCARFKFLILFSVERDWCALTKALLDILAYRSMNNDVLQQEALEMLSEVHLLNRAVKRKCRKMVDLLLHYSVRHEEKDSVFLFPPNMAGPGGITPLHLAASMQDTEDIVDALTSDPQEIGLRSWNSLQDDSAQSPYMYAVARNNNSYNKLVARKITDRKNGQVTISVGNGEINIDKSAAGELEKSTLQTSSCSQCALEGRWRNRVTFRRTNGLLQWPYVHSMLAIAAVCVCVAVFLRGMPKLGRVDPFKWEAIDYGSM